MAGETDSRTPLHLAQSVEEAQAALDSDPSLVGLPDGLGMYAIHMAASTAAFGHAKLLLDAGEDPQALTPSNKTPVHFAAAAGNTSVLGLLLQAGTKVDATDSSGCTALHYAAMFNHFPVILQLIKAGAKLDVSDRSRRTALHYVCNHDCPEAISTFVERGGCDINAKDRNGNTALHVAAACGQMRVVNELINLRANMTALNNEGNVPMHLAVLSGQAKVLHKFLTLGVPVDFPSPKTNNTALYCAALIGRADIIGFLVKLDAEVFVECERSETPLHAVATHGHLECAKLLVEIGANVTVEDEFGQTPLHKAAMNGHVDIVEFLVRKAPHTVKYRDNSQLTPMGLAAKHQHKACMHHLMQTEATTPAWKDKRGRTRLHWAACAGDEQLVRSLLSKGAVIPVNQLDRDKRTPLLWAISSGHEDTVRALLEHGGNMALPDALGNTAIHFAVAKGASEILHMMLGARSNIVELDLRNNEGQTALHWAVKKRKLQCARFLLDRGADVTIVDEDGKAPIDYARREHDKEMEELLSPSS